MAGECHEVVLASGCNFGNLCLTFVVGVSQPSLHSFRHRCQGVAGDESDVRS